ncbi:MAG: hypothetical protein ACRDK7_11020 [Solirubrobacteraceae bacterium]
MNAQVTFDPDAAMAVGMAGTALPFAGSPEEEAERWLRILRLYGDAGIALQALGVSEAPLEVSPEVPPRSAAGEERRSAKTSGSGGEIVAAVTEAAVRAARRRGLHTVGTSDVLVGAMHVYGADFDRVLWVHGTDRDEVLERLGVEISGVPDG